MNSVIVCEGKTDGILISYGLIKLTGCEHISKSEAKKAAGLSFSGFEIEWYRRINAEESYDYIGIAFAGGNDFTCVTEQLAERNKFQFAISKILVITDHDDKTAENMRLSGITEIIKEKYALNELLIESGKWNDIDVTDALGQNNVISFYYMLIPEHDFGAMETFVFNSIGKTGEDEQNAAEQVGSFVDGFSSKKFLTKRREKTKAKLSVLLSLISPDRTFTTLNEYLESVEWAEFEGYKDTFKPILDI